MLSRIGADHAFLTASGMLFSQLATHLSSHADIPLTSDQRLALAWNAAERATIEQEQVGKTPKNAIQAAQMRLERLSQDRTGNVDVTVLQHHIEQALVDVQKPENQEQIKQLAETTRRYLKNHERHLPR